MGALEWNSDDNEKATEVKFFSFQNVPRVLFVVQTSLTEILWKQDCSKKLRVAKLKVNVFMVCRLALVKSYLGYDVTGSKVLLHTLV